ncbi:hypothetical protein SCJ90_20315, partial [Haloferax volcanii]|nr:hypothetical protein [Haloferax volcanii]
AECDLCGESVPLEKAVPNKREEPVHKRCYVDAYGGPVWMEDYLAGFNQQSDVPIGRCWLRAWLHRE